MRKLLVLLLVLAPAVAYLARTGFSVPHLGHFADDGLYAGTAAAIAEGKGPLVESLPGEPFQVRYPPLFPLYLSLGAGRDARLAALLWLAFGAMMWAIWDWRKDWLTLAIVGWNAYSVLFAGSALSEVFSTVWLVLAITSLERGHVARSALLASAAYLARTALLALAAGSLVWLLWKRRWRDAAVYGVLFAPAFLGWAWFVATHGEPGATGTRLVYISYTRFLFENVTWETLPGMMGTNLGGLFQALSGLLFFNGGDAFWEVNFARLVLFAAISGLVRLARERGVGPFELVSVFVCALLVVWNYLPHERFVYPLLPLLAAGLARECRHLAQMLRNNWDKQRGAAIVLGALMGAGALWAAHRAATSALLLAPSLPARFAAILPERAKAHAWVREHTRAEDNFLVYEEAALRRETGRHGIGFHFPTRYFYAADNQAIQAYHRDILERMRAENLRYLFVGPYDLELDIGPADREKIVAHWMSLPELETVYESRLYRIRKLKSDK